MSNTYEQEKVNELVERFYDKLLKDSYYKEMFEQRNVDIELLKSRQRSFLNRLISEDSPCDQDNQVSQVKERHSFHIDPQRADVWLGNMKETMNEMRLEESIKEPLLEKITLLMKNLTN